MSMPVGAATWSFTEDDFGAITITLQRFLYDAKCRCALIVDRSGQLVATVGEPPAFDATAFATLTAAVYALAARVWPAPVAALLSTAARRLPCCVPKPATRPRFHTLARQPSGSTH